MKHKKTITVLLFTTLLLLFVSVASAAVVVVDNFSDGSLSVSAVAPNSASAFEDATGVLGGQRDVLITAGGTAGRELAVNVFSGTPGSMAFDQATGEAGTAHIQWDGDDGGSTTLNFNLGPVDLTDSSSNDGFLVRITFDDSPIDLTITAYTDVSNFETATINLPGDIFFGESVDFFVPFSSFGGGSGTMQPSSIDAVTLDIDGTVTGGADMEYSLFQASGDREFGDLPISFSTATRDASHIPQGLRLGANLDTESAHQPNGPATGDDSASTPDDEDGVVRSDPNWNDGNGDVTVTVNGCTGTCYVNGWMEFGNGTNSTLDFDFTDANEYIIQDFAVTANGAQNTPSFTIPTYADMTSNSVYARFRVCPTINTCDTPTAVDVTNGEIEDYLWEFGPTAITLQNATAENPQNNMVLALVLGMVGLGVTSLILHKKQRATGN